MAIDTETTDLDVKIAEVIELGYAVFESSGGAPIHVSSSFLRPKGSITEEIEKITGISNSILDQFGEPPKEVLSQLLDDIVTYDVSYLVGHNLKGYDIPVLKRNMEVHGLSMDGFKLQLVDTLLDLPLEYEPKSKKLSYMCADHGFLISFAHRALFDALASAKLLFCYPFEKVLALSSSPDVTVRAVVGFNDNSKAKKRGFRWEPEKKWWIKSIKKCHLEKEIKSYDFQAVIV
jgi:DNA polymerase III alpha subunit (gram-positive type)